MNDNRQKREMKPRIQKRDKKKKKKRKRHTERKRVWKGKKDFEKDTGKQKEIERIENRTK